MSVIHRAIGIDLGTTNSVMAMMRSGEPRVILNGQGDPLTASVVSLGKRGELLVGKAAKNRAFDKNTILSIKRFMGLPFELVEEDKRRVSYDVSQGPGGEVRLHFNNRVYSPTEISAIILHRLRQDAQDRLGERVGRAVVTVPAYFNDAQVAATREAGRMAGFTVMRIIREPTAAALAFGLDRGIENADTASVLVYDLGGGTFDISIMMMVQGIYNVLGIEGDKHLGGDDFDYEIMKHLYQRATSAQDLTADQQARRSLKLKAEEAKIELSNTVVAEINIPMVAGVNIEDEVTREDFNRLLTPWITHTVELMHKAMRETNMTTDLIDHILLVGGSTLIPYVQEMLRREFGDKKIKKNVDPMQCVALGAAIQTSLIDQIECPNPDCHDESGQQTKNPIDATECRRCKTSLIGFDVMTCPVCYVPTDASQPTCRKCKSNLREGAAGKAVPVSPPPSQHWKCLDCGFPKNLLSAQACEICGKQRDTGGVKCIKCGYANPPGQVNCVKCGEPMGGVFEAVPENLGVQLQDGRMAVVVEKNTSYPTPTPISKDFYTAEANAKQIEVIVRQGASEQAAENDYCGVVLLDLPPGLPKGATVTVSLGLDSDGTIVATVQLRDFPNRRATARILRGGISDPKVRHHRDELLKKAKEALDQGKDAPQAAPLAKQVRELEAQGQSVSNEDLEQFEKELQSFQDVLGQQGVIQNALQNADLILHGAKDYLPADNAADLERLSNNVRQAVARGQTEQAQRCAQELQEYIDQHQILLLLALLELVRNSGKISVGLANRIGAGLRTFKTARSQAEAEQCFVELMAAWKEVEQEFEKLGEKVPGTTGLVDSRHR